MPTLKWFSAYPIMIAIVSKILETSLSTFTDKVKLKKTLINVLKSGNYLKILGFYIEFLLFFIFYKKYVY